MVHPRSAIQWTLLFHCKSNVWNGKWFNASVTRLYHKCDEWWWGKLYSGLSESESKTLS